MTTIRDVLPSDIPELLRITEMTWMPPRRSEELAEYVVSAYLSDSVSRSTFGRVAATDNGLAGYVFVSVAGEEPFGDIVPVSERPLRAAEYDSDTEIYKNVCARLKEEHAPHCGCELVLLAVDPAHRGRGTGRALFREALAHFRERGGKEFYLFSDNTCDYTFYDAHGLTRVGTDHTFGKSFTVFMYKGPL